MTKLLKQAEAGDLRSQTALALSYEVGIVTEVNLEQAIYWWKEAAINGDPQANEKVKELESKSNKKVEGLKRKALIVGNDTRELETYQKTLGKLSFNALTCRTSNEALKVIFQNPDICLLLIDIELQGKSGVKLTRELKKSQMLDRAKIILMSSNTSEKTIKEGRKLNLEKLLIKPFPPETLMEAVEKVFQLKKDAA